MRGRSFVVAAMVALGLAAGGCAAQTVQGPAPAGPRSYGGIETIKGGGDIHEDCLEMGPGNMLTYSFGATGLVDFNVHYHHEGRMAYEVRSEATMGDSGEFSPGARNYYCFMWTNRGEEQVELNYRYEAR